MRNVIAALAAAMCGALSATGAQRRARPNARRSTSAIASSRISKPAIDANVTKIRKLISEQKAAGKAIGYLSIPISTVGGSYFGVSSEVAARTKATVEKRLGANSAWLLNPGESDFGLPAGANGADYMLQWTRVLEGTAGLGEDFDFFYFAGPSDFATALGLTGEADMEKIDALFDRRYATDEGLRKAVEQGKVSKARSATTMRYAPRSRSVTDRTTSGTSCASSTSAGAARPTAASPSRSPVWFDGRAAVPGAYEQAIAAGDAGRCIN